MIIKIKHFLTALALFLTACTTSYGSEEQQSPFESLPREMKKHCCSFIRERQTLTRLRQVSKELCKIATEILVKKVVCKPKIGQIEFLQDEKFLSQVPIQNLDLCLLPQAVLKGLKLGKLAPSLQYLNLHSQNLDAKDLQELEIPQLIHLKELVLALASIGSEGPKHLAQLTNLTSLNIAENNIGSEGIKHLAPLTNLTSLNITGNNIGSEGTRYLAPLTNLTSLNLRSNNIDAEGAKQLVQLPKLTQLSLRANNVGDQGAEALAQLKNLTEVDLFCNGIGEKGAEHLAQLPHLIELNLQANNMSSEKIEELKERLSWIKDLIL